MNEEPRLRALICEYGRRLYQRNLVAATDGNLSVRLAEGRFLCTPSGVSKGFMEPGDLLIADGQAGRLEGEGRVTTEFTTHLAAYEERPEVMAVVHAHPPCATALSLAGVSMDAPLLPEVVMSLGTVPTAPYATPGSPEGAGSIRALIRNHDALLLDRHGAITVGRNLTDAYFKMEKLEHAAYIVIQARLLGTPAPLSEDAVQRALAACAGYTVR